MRWRNRTARRGGAVLAPNRMVAGLMCAWAWLCLVVLPVGGQEKPPETSGVVHVLGLEEVPRNVKGAVRVDSGALRFAAGKVQGEIPLARVDDVFTGDDSQRVVRGTLQALSTFAPYGGGRFLSLFRTKVDLLTVQYRDASGGRHGAIFTLPDGKAFEVKRQMVAAGARTSVPVEEEMRQKEQREKEKKEGKKEEGKKP